MSSTIGDLFRISAAGGALVALAVAAGCGSTRTSNTMRTATEQLLISDAMERSVDAVDFSPLRDKTVYLDDSRLAEVVDRGYLVSSLRQRMLASGCVLKDAKDQAEFVVEARAGAVGTDNHDLLFGIPSVNLPQLTVLPTLPAAIPEIPFAKRHNQRGVAKLALFAYRRDTGEPAWQSGLALEESTANDVWVLGAGPFQRGSIYESTRIAGKELDKVKSAGEASGLSGDLRTAQLTERATFAGLSTRITPPPVLAAPYDPQVLPASAELPLGPAKPLSEASPP